MAPDGDRRVIGWPRASATAVAVLVTAAVVVVIGANVLVTTFGGLPRSTRVGLATGWFFLSLLALAWGLRRLQARRLL